MKQATLFLVLMVLGVAHAGEAALTWTTPTQRCDGTALTNLAGYTLTYGQAREALPLAPLTKTIVGLTPGTWWFSIAAVDAQGEVSEFITVSKVVEPADFKTTGTTVYTLVKAVDRFVILPVGSAPAGTICKADQTVNGYYVVPRTAVTWSGSIRPDVVVAPCS